MLSQWLKNLNEHLAIHGDPGGIRIHKQVQVSNYFKTNKILTLNNSNRLIVTVWPSRSTALLPIAVIMIMNSNKSIPPNPSPPALTHFSN